MKLITGEAKPSTIRQTMSKELRDYLKERLGVPNNWDKFDYQTQRYSFEDIEDILESKLKEAEVEKNSARYDLIVAEKKLQAVKDNLMSDEDKCREAFQLGQQWVKDMEDDKAPLSFNDWWKENELKKH